jgi:phage terminase small subunit
MPILRNPRREKFAQELAAGHSAAEAYKRAGYKPNYGNCIRLKGNERVAARVAEIQYGGAARAEVTIASVLGELEEARTFAKEKSNPSAMVSATMSKAKILGLIIDRREVGDVGAFDNLTDEQLVEEAWRRARELGIAGPRLVEDDNKKSL